MEEDQESKSLLVIESTSKSLKANPSIYIYLIGITIISAILAVAYSTSGIVNKSYSVFSELNAQAPEPSSTVSYNGKIYASLGGGDVNGLQNKCQSDRYLIPPNGWEVAPDDADSRGVTAAYPWDTHVNVMSNGCGYGSASYTKGVQWSCGMLGQSGNAYKVNSCSLMILIRKVNIPQAPEPSSTVSYNGKIYASLGGGDVNGLQNKCQSDRYLIPPNGWEIAPDDADSRGVTAAYPWDTHVNVMSNGCGYGSASYTKGVQWSCGMLGSNGAGGYKVNSCSLMVLIMKSVPPYKYAPNPSLMIQYKGYYYASLSGADPHSSTYTCQQEYLALPQEGGWEVAPEEVDSRAANTMYQWNTAVNVFSNGYGYGTGAWNVGLWNYNMLSKVDKGGGVFEYKPNACYLQILIRKLVPTSSPTLFPIALPTNHPVPNPTEMPTTNPSKQPTKEPISRPTQNPTIEPTHVPTEKPSFKPTHEPTLEPTKNPTFQPSAHPSKEPSAEPSSSPIKISYPTHEPIPNPTMSPTHEPSHQPTLKPTDHPTFNPTFEPTHIPTIKPSFKPTYKPTLEPTKNPTFQPSAQPTKEPTAEPTKEPTHKPSLHPTELPSMEPTLFPTYKSTNYPTGKPTTAFPSIRPTLSPTHKPSQEPELLKSSICKFEFVKGKTSAEVTPGCALITGEDIDKMLPGQDTHALYVCATRDIPAYLKKEVLVEYGMEGGNSFIFPEKDTNIIMFSDDNFRGSKVYNDGIKAFIGDQSVNSLVVQSIVDHFELKAECNVKM